MYFVRYAACTGKENSSPPTKSSTKQRKRKARKPSGNKEKKWATGTIIIASDPPQPNCGQTPPQNEPSSTQGSSTSSVLCLTPSRRLGGGPGLKPVERSSATCVDEHPKVVDLDSRASKHPSDVRIDMDISMSTSTCTSTSSSEGKCLSESGKYLSDYCRCSVTW